MEIKDSIERRSLVANGILNKKNLKRNQYTLSLMNEGVRTGLIDSREVVLIQNKLMLILQKLLKRYTRGESSSVSTEAAESILASMMYAIDAYMLGFETPEQAMTYLKTVDIRNIYDKGVERVSQCFEETKQLYKVVKNSKLNVPVDAYNMTIDESLPVFIKKYGIIFDAHNTMASIDYPLAIDDMRIQGVFYIRQYLERLYMETGFCHLFRHEDLIDTLANFGRVCRFDYRIELFNIFELMLNQAIFSVLSGRAAREVQITPYQYEQLNRMLSSWQADHISAAVQEATVRIQDELQISDPLMLDYMNQCARNLVRRITHAANHQSLRQVIIAKQEDRIKPVAISLNPEDRMSDAELRQLIDEVTRCDRKEDKARLLKSRLYSLHDYLDILSSDSLYGDEYAALFEMFGEMELAILAKIVFYEELRSDSLNFQAIFHEKREFGESWHDHFAEFMQGLNLDQIKTIEKWINIIDYEEIKFY